MGTRVLIVDAVHVYMFFKSVNLVEGLITNGAVIGKHFSGVDLQMASQSRIGKEPFATFLAG